MARDSGCKSQIHWQHRSDTTQRRPTRRAAYRRSNAHTLRWGAKPSNPLLIRLKSENTDGFPACWSAQSEEGSWRRDSSPERSLDRQVFACCIMRLEPTRTTSLRIYGEPDDCSQRKNCQSCWGNIRKRSTAWSLPDSRRYVTEDAGSSIRSKLPKGWRTGRSTVAESARRPSAQRGD